MSATLRRPMRRFPVCGVDVPATAKAAELLRQWLARPENMKSLATRVANNLPDDPSYCDDPGINGPSLTAD